MTGPKFVIPVALILVISFNFIWQCYSKKSNDSDIKKSTKLFNHSTESAQLDNLNSVALKSPQTIIQNGIDQQAKPNLTIKQIETQLEQDERDLPRKDIVQQLNSNHLNIADQQNLLEILKNRADLRTQLILMKLDSLNAEIDKVLAEKEINK